MYANTDTTMALPNRRDRSGRDWSRSDLNSDPGRLSRPAPAGSDLRPAACRPESRWRTTPATAEQTQGERSYGVRWDGLRSSGTGLNQTRPSQEWARQALAEAAAPSRGRFDQTQADRASTSAHRPSAPSVNLACRPTRRDDRRPDAEAPETGPHGQSERLNDRREPESRNETGQVPDYTAATDQRWRRTGPGPETVAANSATADSAAARADARTTVDTEQWSPGANRCRTPITAEPSPEPAPATAATAAAEDGFPPEGAVERRCCRESGWSPGKMQGVRKPSWGGRFVAKLRGESGMSTAEYAVGTLAAVAFAGVLLKVLTSGPVQGALSSLIERALS